jgi:4-hydroxybenzoate polyprenyltransferase
MRTAFKIFWIGVCAVVMTAQTFILMRIDVSRKVDYFDEISLYLLIFVGFSAIFGYNFSYTRTIIRYSAWFAGLVSAFVFFKLNVVTQIMALIPVLILGFYYGFKMPGTKTGVRRSTFAKPGAIAIAWAWMTVVLPATISYKEGIIWIFLERIAFISALALAYDLNDIENDQKNGLQTFPVKYGSEKTMLLANLLLLLTALLVVINWYSGFYDLKVVFAFCSSLLISYFILHTMTRKMLPFYWYKNCVDGLMLLQTLSIWVVSYFFF